ncbi:MAG: AIR synthase-related protein, partial [Planctomycetota bacterium]|nr:AIR synthase-related protein [Planctomycetota bacterium]
MCIRDSDGLVPRVDLAAAPGIVRAVAGAISSGLVRACHDLSEGGMAVAAAEMAFAGMLGAEIWAGAVPCDGEVTAAGRLFAESPTRFLLEVAPEHAGAIEALFRRGGPGGEGVGRNGGAGRGNTGGTGPDAGNGKREESKAGAPVPFARIGRVTGGDSLRILAGGHEGGGGTIVSLKLADLKAAWQGTLRG